jgi:MarR family 2-MHQ and catechol resistance regulon transcriptional repressor
MTEHSDAAEAGTLALRLWAALARAHAAVHAHATDDLARHELTPAEFAVLDALFRAGPLPVGEAQRRAAVSSGGITYLLDRLHERALVERRGHPLDRRARIAALTPAGDALVRGIGPEHAAEVKAALSGLGKKEKREALRLLQMLEGD